MIAIAELPDSGHDTVFETDQAHQAMRAKVVCPLFDNDFEGCTIGKEQFPFVQESAIAGCTVPQLNSRETGTIDRTDLYGGRLAAKSQYFALYGAFIDEFPPATKRQGRFGGNQ